MQFLFDSLEVSLCMQNVVCNTCENMLVYRLESVKELRRIHKNEPIYYSVDVNIDHFAQSVPKE